MEKEIKMAALVDEEGEEFELEVIKEFEHKGKNYAVLYEDSCGCEEECECEVECDCDDECDGDCKCECHGDDECEGHIYVLEVTKDADGKETYSEINSELMDELLPIVEKKLYPTEE